MFARIQGDLASMKRTGFRRLRAKQLKQLLIESVTMYCNMLPLLSTVDVKAVEPRLVEVCQLWYPCVSLFLMVMLFLQAFTVFLGLCATMQESMYASASRMTVCDHFEDILRLLSHAKVQHVRQACRCSPYT